MDSVSDHTKSFEKSPLYSIPNFDKEYSTRDLVSQGTTKSFGDDSVQIIEGDDNVEIRGEANKDEIFFPEGGLAAWLVVFGSWCALFSSLGIMNTMGSFQLYISTNQLVIYNTDDVSWIFSLYAFLSFGVSLFVGPIFDNYGPRWLIMLGGALVTVSMATIGVSQSMFNSCKHESVDKTKLIRILALHPKLLRCRRSWHCITLCAIHRHCRTLL